MATGVYETNSLGYKLSFNGPKSSKITIRKLVVVGACLEDACDNTIYRGTLPEWQDAFASAVEEKLKEKRGTDTAATERAKSRAKDPSKIQDVPEKVPSSNASPLVCLSSRRRTHRSCSVHRQRYNGRPSPRSVHVAQGKTCSRKRTVCSPCQPTSCRPRSTNTCRRSKGLNSRPTMPTSQSATSLALSIGQSSTSYCPSRDLGRT